MNGLTQSLIAEGVVAGPHAGYCASRFSPAEIRHAIADLVALNNFDMANALSDAGLSLYPDNEDVLSISALLAELKQDWQTAQQHLEKLLEQQGKNSKAVVWRHLIRVVRCQLEPRKALRLAKQAIRLHPQDTDLQKELSALCAESAEHTLTNAGNMAH
jgi:tetratricopeptide (TPR) repeat protein